MGMPIGKQDQYVAAFGGLNKITFMCECVAVEPLTITLDIRQALENRLMLFFTGSSRGSTSILKHQRNSTEERNDTVLQVLHNIKQVVAEVQMCLEKGDLYACACLLHYGWQEKRRLAPSLSTGFIDECYSLTLEHGAIAGKITSAGGGGFLLLYCPQGAIDYINRVKSQLAKILLANPQ